MLDTLKEIHIFWELNVDEVYECFDDIIHNLESSNVKDIFK